MAFVEDAVRLNDTNQWDYVLKCRKNFDNGLGAEKSDFYLELHKTLQESGITGGVNSSTQDAVLSQKKEIIADKIDVLLEKYKFNDVVNVYENVSDKKPENKISLLYMDINSLSSGDKEKLKEILFQKWNPNNAEKLSTSPEKVTDAELNNALKLFNTIYFGDKNPAISDKTAQALDFIESGKKLVDFKDENGQNPFLNKSPVQLELYETVRKNGILNNNSKPSDFNYKAAIDVLTDFGFNNAGGKLEKLSGPINEAAKAYNVDPYLLTAVIAYESNFNSNAESYCGAQGLMQLMPETAAGLGVNDSFNPLDNIMGGAKYLQRQLNVFKDVRKALAAYNAGPGNVYKYGGIPPFEETKNYVANISRLYGALKSNQVLGD